MRNLWLTTALSLLSACASLPYDSKNVSHPIREHFPDFDVCAANDPSHSKGHLDVHFVIGPSGRITEANIQKSTLGKPAVETCVIETIRHIQFAPPSDAQSINVVYPFNFGN